MAFLRPGANHARRPGMVTAVNSTNHAPRLSATPTPGVSHGIAIDETGLETTVIV